MKLKSKLIATISAFCLVCVMLVVGIYALKSANFQMGGEINFKATGVNATISKGTLATGSHVNSSDATTKMQGFSITTAEDQDEINSLASSWSGLKLQFNEAGDDATITFTIKNDNTVSDQYLKVSTSASLGTADNATVSVSPKEVTIYPEETETFVVTFSVTQKDMDASLKGFVLDFDLTHTNIIPTVSSQPYLSYKLLNDTDAEIVLGRYGETTTLYMSKGYGSNLQGLTIPETIVVNEISYNITKLSGSVSKDFIYKNESDEITDPVVILPSTIKYIDCPDIMYCYAVMCQSLIPPELSERSIVDDGNELYIHVPYNSLNNYINYTTDENPDEYTVFGWLAVGENVPEYIASDITYEREASWTPYSFTLNGQEATAVSKAGWSSYDGLYLPQAVFFYNQETNRYSYYIVTAVSGAIGDNSLYQKVNFNVPFTIKNIDCDLTYVSKLIFNASNPPSVSANTLSSYSGTIYVPAESVEVYKTAWPAYADRIVANT